MKDADVEADNRLSAAVTAAVSFDAAVESVAQGRRLVVTQLDAWGLSELSDDARLVVSELLTNAALHARPPLKMRLGRLPAGVRVEVSDGSAELPLLIRAGADVMTGRGWTIVDALCRDWGVAPVGHGKVVWATLVLEHAAAGEWPASSAPADSHTVPTDLLALAEPSAAHNRAVTRYEVSLGDVPTSLLVAAKAHIDALTREFALMASGAIAGESPVPAELTLLIEQVVGNFAEARQSIKKQALLAAERHDPRTRLTLNLPVTAAEAGLAYLAALDEVDAYCRAKRMLTLETPPAHRVFRPLVRRGARRRPAPGCRPPGSGSCSPAAEFRNPAAARVRRAERGVRGGPAGRRLVAGAAGNRTAEASRVDRGSLATNCLGSRRPCR